MLKTVRFDSKFTSPHVVLLGAGGSRAITPEGDYYGHRLPVMADFVDTLQLQPLFDTFGFHDKSANFEDTYSRVASDPCLTELRQAVDEAVFAYFAQLRIPADANAYDHLILGLREKDAVATFNWDPFLIQAAIRNRSVARPPKLLFLHGNVLEGFCTADAFHGQLGAKCPRCEQPLSPAPLLFPVAEKNYERHPSIRDAWSYVRTVFSSAFMVTVFGYSAPQSDVSARNLLREAWGNNRELEQFEFIDIRNEDELVPSWLGFVDPADHHYEVHTDFSHSWIARHPRRTGEAWWKQFLEAEFIEDNRCPYSDLRDAQEWYADLNRDES